MSMPIGVGIVIDDQLQLNQNDQKDGAKGQSQQDRKDTTGTVANQSQQGPKGNQGAATDTNQQNQADNESGSANNSNQDQDKNGDAINNIVYQLEEANVPLVKYADIPSPDVINNFGQVAFLLLDWKLLAVESVDKEQTDEPNPVQTGDTQQQKELEEKLSFIEEFHKICFAPVLLFTNEDIDVIKEKLVGRNLYRGDKTDFIFIRRKAELKSVKGGKNVVVETVSKWVQSTPVTHLVSEWNRSVFSAQSKMFHDFWQSGHEWPQILWSAYEGDHSAPSRELTELLGKNLFSRITCSFDKTLFESPSSQSANSDADVIRVLEGANFIGSNSLDIPNGCGDLFLLEKPADIKEEDFFPYLLLISCDCDITQDSAPEDNYLVLVGKSVPLTEGLHKKGGVVENPGSHYAFPIHGAKCVRFDFKKHRTYEPNTLRSLNRVGRITPPLLTVIRQRYAQWVQREGLPAMPKLTRS